VAASHLTVNQSTLGKGGQHWSNRLTRGSLSLDSQPVKWSTLVKQAIFYTIFGMWFLCRNPKWPKKERIVWLQFIANQTIFGNFPEPQILNGI